MNTKLKYGLAGLVAGFVAAAVALPAAAAPSYKSWGSFVAIDNTPDVTFTPINNHGAGSLPGGLITTTGGMFGTVPVLASIFNDNGLALVDIPAALQFNGGYVGLMGNSTPIVGYAWILTYAGAPPLVIDGQTFNAGAKIESFGPGVTLYDAGQLLAEGSMDTELFNDARYRKGSSLITFDPGPVVAFEGSRPTFVAGSSVISGMWNQSETPEPATWVLSIVGFGFVGAAMRRRRHAVVEAA